MNKKAFPHAISTVVVLCVIGIICAFFIVSALDANETAFYVDQNGHVQSYKLFNRGYIVFYNLTSHPACNATIEGSIYYNGTDFEKCLGVNWQSLNNNTNVNYYNNVTSALKFYSNISALQGENTTIWNTLYELNSNDTANYNWFNTSVELRPMYNATLVSYASQALKHYSNITALQGENRTIWSILNESVQNNTNQQTSINEATTNITNLQGSMSEATTNISTLQGYGDYRTHGYYNALANFTSGSLINNYLCYYNDAVSKINCDLGRDNSGDCSAGTICEGGHTHTDLNATIELRAPLASPDFTGDIELNGGYDSGGISLTSNGSALIYDDLLLGGNLLSVSTTSINGTYLPSSTSTYNLGSYALKWKWLYADEIKGAAFNWTYLQNYPSACGAGEAVTTIGDTNTCTAFLQSSSAVIQELTTNSSQAIKHYSNISALQGENTTIWNTLWELNSNDTTIRNSVMEATTNITNLATEVNQNDTMLNATIELRAPLASPSFTGTVTSAGAINQTLTFGTGSTLVTMFDFGNTSIRTNGTHLCIIGKSSICVET